MDNCLMTFIIKKDQKLQTTAFGELAVSEPTPVVQVLAQNGLNDKTGDFAIGSGTVTAENSEFNCSTGTDADGFATVFSAKSVQYRAGQGALCRLTARFTTGVADSQQRAGFASTVDGFQFGFDGVDFGVLHRHDGQDAIQILTITTPAAGAENATITIDGTPYTVPLTAGTVQFNATEIAASLNSQVFTFIFQANNDEVTALSFLPVVYTIFSFSSGTAVAAWAIDNTGAEPIDDWIPQSSWNRDTFAILDPTKGNVYQIRYQYLGYGAIDFSIEDPVTGDFVLVHRIEYANSATSPSIADPIMRVAYAAFNTGSTTDISIHGSSMSGFNEGKVIMTEPARSASVSRASATVTTGVLTPLITLRNRLVKGSNRSRQEILPIQSSVFTDANKGVFVNVLRNADISSDSVYQFVDTDNSIAEIDTSATTVTGGDLLFTDFVPSGQSIKQLLSILNDVIIMGETVTVAAIVPSGATGDITATLTWQEDL